MRQYYRMILVGCLLIVALTGCGEEGNSQNKQVAADKKNKKTVVKTMKLIPKSFANYLEVTGTVKARHHIKIIVEEGGILKQILVNKGNSAKAGKTLAILENKVLKASYNQAKANLDQARLDFSSKKVLYKKKAISENEFLSSKYSLNASKAAYDLAEARYNKLFIKAPISGMVNNRFYDLGAYINPMNPLFEFIDNEYLVIRAGVAERFLGDISENTPVKITFDAYPEMIINSKVSFVSQSIDPQNRTFEIEIGLSNRDRKLAPQMIANIRILRQAFKNRIVIPLDAMIESESGWHVFIEENMYAKRLPVKQVAVYEDRVLVDGLTSNQRLIVVGHQELSEGDSLEVFIEENDSRVQVETGR